MSTMDIVKRTFPFFIARFIAYALFALITILFIGLTIGLGVLFITTFNQAFFALFLVVGLGFVGLYGGLQLLERYFLYIIKVGHISVIVELVRGSDVPEGKEQIAFGKEQVKKNFGSANVAFIMDKMIHRAVKQIQGWLMRATNFLNFIPAAANVMRIINSILSVGLNYIDEAVLSYTILRRNEEQNESIWKSAADGIVLYAQSWKSMIKTAAGSVALIYGFTIGSFLLLIFPFIGLARLIAGNTDLGAAIVILSVIASFTLAITLKRGLIDPIITIAMIRSYQLSIKDREPALDLEQKLLSASSWFKNLFEKAKREEREAM